MREMSERVGEEELNEAGTQRRGTSKPKLATRKILDVVSFDTST